MKIFIFLSISVTLVLGCSEPSSNLEVCNKPDGDDCSCQDGLTCVLTKIYVLQGSATPVKQCMPADMEIDVETINMDKNQQGSRSNRIFPGLGGKRCSSEADCQQNQCCVRFVNKCLPKLPELAECFLKIIHGCGCQDGLECRKTGEITIPIIGIRFPLLQCVSSLPGGNIA